MVGQFCKFHKQACIGSSSSSFFNLVACECKSEVSVRVRVHECMFAGVCVCERYLKCKLGVVTPSESIKLLCYCNVLFNKLLIYRTSIAFPSSGIKAKGS